MKPTTSKIIVYIITLAVSIAYIFIGHAIATRHAFESGEPTYETYRARVETADQMPTRFFDASVSSDGQIEAVHFTARITSGDLKGMRIEGQQQMETYYSTNRKYVEPGDKILVMQATDATGQQAWLWLEYVRTDALIVFGALFCIALVIFGLGKGVNTLISLTFTCLSIFYVFLPAILAGENPYTWSIITCLYITLMTLLLVNGASKKSFVAGIGCFSGTMAAALLMWLMDSIMHLTGVLNDESIYLLLLETDYPINLKGIIFAGVIIGAVGAIMDVSMSITSPLFELYDHMQGNISAIELVKSGLRIGRDFMSTMSNTLVLAYIGCDLSLVLLLMAYNTSFLEMMNREMLVTEVLQAITGSFGILLTIPLASVVCAIVLCGPLRGNRTRARKISGLSNYDLAAPRHGRRPASRPQV